jgi:3-oxoacyl-[acyl-carrier protein] reductase
MTLDNKSAIVTGACMGIGASIAIKLAQYGANVTIIDLKSFEDSKAVIDKISSFGRKSLFIHADTSNFADAAIAVQQVLDEFGSLDILVNNAGINKDAVIWKMSEEEWDSVMNVNLKGYFNYIRHISPIFKEQKHGKIVNVSSINGLRGKFGQSNYSTSKAGVIALTKTVARELGKYSVNVNAVAPGLILTEMMEKLPEDVKNTALNDIVLNRIGMPDDIANTVAFLCSELSRHITGEVIKVDGGQYI